MLIKLPRRNRKKRLSFVSLRLTILMTTERSDITDKIVNPTVGPRDVSI